MMPGKIEGATRDLLAPKNWNKDRDGECASLPIRDAMLEDTNRPCMVSAWVPTAEELERLNAGASIELCVVGIVHPPVSLGVGPAPRRMTAVDALMNCRRLIDQQNGECLLCGAAEGEVCRFVDRASVLASAGIEEVAAGGCAPPIQASPAQRSKERDECGLDPSQVVVNEVFMPEGKKT